MSVGQLGSVARLALTYEDAGSDVPQTAMVKWPSKDAGSRAIGVTLGVYEGEVRFYQEIAPTIGTRVPGCIGRTSNRRPAGSPSSSRT